LRYLFEDYELDTARRELRRDNAVVPVEPQVFDLLAYLVSHRDRVVTKDDLLTAVWNGRIVSESALTTRMNAVRAALCDSGEAQRLIRTLRGRGFRFIGDARASVDASANMGEVAKPRCRTPTSRRAGIPRRRLAKGPQLKVMRHGLRWRPPPLVPSDVS